MSHKRTHIVIPEEMADEIDRIVGKRGRSQFLVEAAQREIRRLRMIRAVERAVGSWKATDHPELKQGAASWVRKVRQEEEKQLQRRAARKK